MPSGNRLKTYYQDRLVSVHTLDGKRDLFNAQFRKGKRVAAGCPLTRDEIRVYVEHGIVRCCQVVMANRAVRLHEAKRLIDCARFGTDKDWENPSLYVRPSHHPILGR